jgi:Gas vesicle protein
MTIQPIHSRRQPDSLADVLERVLDKGIVIAGDVVVNVLDIELLTLKLRLFIASADTAREMGMDWWTTDPFFSSNAHAPEITDGEDSGEERQVGSGGTARSSMRELRQENQRLRQRLAALESGERRGQRS